MVCQVGVQHARRRAQFAWPALGLPLAALGVLSELGPVIGHRRADAADRRRLFGPQRRSAADRWSRLRELVATPAPGRV